MRRPCQLLRAGFVSTLLAPSLVSARPVAPPTRSPPAAAAGTAPQASTAEAKVKAAFLYSFAMFVQWPKSRMKSGELVIGILGEGPFGVAADALNGKPARGAKIVVRRLQAGDPRARDCHILFVSPSEGQRIAQVLASVEGAGVLTAGDGEAFTKQGGMMGFGSKGDRVTLFVNPAVTLRNGLKISARLLKVATVVQ